MCRFHSPDDAPLTKQYDGEIIPTKTDFIFGDR